MPAVADGDVVVTLHAIHSAVVAHHLQVVLCLLHRAILGAKCKDVVAAINGKWHIHLLADMLDERE